MSQNYQEGGVMKGNMLQTHSQGMALERNLAHQPIRHHNTSKQASVNTNTTSRKL